MASALRQPLRQRVRFRLDAPGPATSVTPVFLGALPYEWTRLDIRQWIRKPQAVGSSPTAGSPKLQKNKGFMA
jgi:hypothetical protein